MNTETPRVFLVTSEEYEVKHSPAYAILKSKKKKKIESRASFSLAVMKAQ